MFLIMSAAYVDNELQSEFGKIPPSFLPLGNRRLYQHQIKLAPINSSIYLSLPDSYIVSERDLHWLEKHSVNIIYMPEGLKLGESLVASLNLAESENCSQLQILFGDTLFKELPNGKLDRIGLSKANGNYNWASHQNEELHWLDTSESDINYVASGYLNISSPKVLIRAIIKAKWNFFEGLSIYNKNINIKPLYLEDWYDFGHVNTYYKSKASFTTQRAFNELSITADSVTKTSCKNIKIKAEANWFANIPEPLKLYTPQLVGLKNDEENFSYDLEYLYQTALNELYVFSELPEHVWFQIFDRCICFLSAMREFKPLSSESKCNIYDLFYIKTISRLDEYCIAKGVRLSDNWSYNEMEPTSLKQLVELSEAHLPYNSESKWTESVMHGDFCFSNILYDFRTNRIKVIDPRGITFSNEITIYGDLRYDIAKLSHSIIGMYDWIIAGYYNVEIDKNDIRFNLTAAVREDVQNYFIKLIEKTFGLNKVELLAMQIQLFLSMLPLHSDDINRQNAILANAFRLYELLKRETE